MPSPTVPYQIEDRRQPGLDTLRTLAILLVFLFHYRIFAHPKWIDAAGSFGWTGVDLFFVLSGYLIAGQLFRQVKSSGSVSLGNFYVKRIFRILPAYLTVVAIYFCVPPFREREALAPLWKYLTFTQNFGLDLRTNGTFSHAWSLCIEEQFYLLLPFIITALVALRWGRSSGWLIGFLFLAGFAARIYSWQHFLQPILEADDFGISWYKWIYYPTYNRLDGLLVGITVAGLTTFYPRARNAIMQRGSIFLTVALALIGLACYICLDAQSYVASVFGFPLVAIAYGCLLCAAISPSCALGRFRSRVISGVAILSYALYLTHKGLIHLTLIWFTGLGVEKDTTLMFLLSLIMCLIGAILIRYVVEKPFLWLKNKVLTHTE